ncbi:hypothetical protein AAHC03_05217 [Spirometra sp. Aus1]
MAAITSVQSIIGPFSSQIRACSYDPLVTPPTESLISAVKRLFGFDFALEEFNFQVGDLLNAIAKICQNSTSTRLPSEVSKLCSDLATIFCCHPRMHSILSCIDRIACLMLRRPENWWRTAGCRLISCISMARCNVLQTFAASYVHLTPCLSSSELFAFTNVSDQEYRSTTYLRLLSRQLRLTEGAISNATELRMHLVLACANFLKDLQYTAFVTPLIFRNTSAAIKLHPFLRSTPLPSTELDYEHDTSLTASSAASVLHSAWMLPDAELRTNPTANASFTSFSSTAGKSRERGKFADEGSCVDDLSADYVVLQTRQLAIYIIKEGLRFLDELLHSPKYETVLGLLYVVRCLRVFAETKGPTFFLSRKQLTSSGYTQSQLPDVSLPLSRFCRLLREVVHLDVPEDQLLSHLQVTKTPTSAEDTARACAIAPAVLTRREQKRAKQRAVKLARREQAAAATISVTKPDEGRQEADAAPPIPAPQAAPKRLDRCALLAHLLKQACIELWWSFALLDCHVTARFAELRDRENPLRPDSTILTHFAKLLTAEAESDFDAPEVGGGGEKKTVLIAALPANLPLPLRILSALTPFNPALSWRWLRVLDRIILHAHRSESLFRDDISSLAAFVAPSLVALWRTFHRWYLRSTANGLGSLRAPRTIVRCAGLLTAFLCHELKEQAWTGTTSVYSVPRKPAPPNNETGLTYDASWIKKTLARSGIVSPTTLRDADVFEPFCDDLAALIPLANTPSTDQSPSPEALLMDQSASSWVWAAVCLRDLVESRYSPAVSRVTPNTDQPSPLAELLCRLRGCIDEDPASPSHLLSTCEPLVYLPSPSTGCYTAPKGWKCTSISRIVFTAKDMSL